MDKTSQVYISLEVIIGAAAILGNTLVLVAIYKYPKLRTVTNCFIASLALADLLVGIFVAPLAALSYLGLPQNYIGCVFTNSIVVVFTQISIFNLVDVAVERFIAIKNPFFYQTHLTVRVALIIIGISWILAIIIGLVPVFGWNLGPMDDNVCSFVKVIDMKYMVYFNFFGFVLTPLIIITLIYSYIFYIVRQQMAKISALEVMNQTNSQRQRRRFRREVKAAKSLAIVIGIFAVCWLPLHILNAIALLCPSCSYSGNLLLAAILLSHFNSAVNPFLYAIGNSQFQIAFKKMFFRKNPEVVDDDYTHVSNSKQQRKPAKVHKNGVKCQSKSESDTQDVTQESETPEFNSKKMGQSNDVFYIT